MRRRPRERAAAFAARQTQARRTLRGATRRRGEGVRQFNRRLAVLRGRARAY